MCGCSLLTCTGGPGIPARKERRLPLLVLAVLVLAAAITPPAAAAGLNLTPAEVDLLFAMREYTLTYNEYAGRLPGWVTGPFADEKVNLRVASPDGVMVIGITFHDRRIMLFDAKGCPAPIATVTTDRATVEEVMASDRPFDAFRAGVRNGTIRIEGNTLLGTLRWGMVGLGLRVMDIIGL